MNSNEILSALKQALDAKSSAQYLGIKPITLCKWRLQGTGPTFRKLGRRVVYLRKDLDSFLEASARRSTSDNGSAC